MTCTLNRREAAMTTTTPECANCGRPAPGTTLCVGNQSCLTDLLNNLTALHRGHHLRTRTHTRFGRQVVEHDWAPGLLADLDDAIARQTRTGLSTASVLAPAEQLLFNETASAAATHARVVLTRWVAALMRTGLPLQLPAPAGQRLTAPLAAEWLATHPTALAAHPQADQLWEDISQLVDGIRRLVDRAPDLTYIGPCDHEIDTNAHCGRDLYAHLHKPLVRCPGCGTQHQVAERRDWLLLRVAEQLATTEEITRALPTLLGEDVASSTIRAWAHQGKLTQYDPHPLDRRARPRYKVKDVLDLASEAIRIKRERAEARDRKTRKQAG